MKDPTSQTPKEHWLETPGGAGEEALRRALDEAAALPEMQPNKQRVWTRVQAPWAPSRARWVAGIGLSAAAAAAVVALVVSGHRRGGVVASRPPVVVPAPVVEALPAPAGTTFLTGPGEEIHRRLAGGVDVVLAPLGALIVGDDAPEVKSGRARFTVPHQAPGQRYLVRAAAYRVVVVGTVFDVAVEASGVSVVLDSGTVEIESVATGQRVARLSQGQRWSSTGTATAPAPDETRGHASVGPAEILASARRARQAGDARGALALYGRLARTRGQLAETAQYEMASIENEDLHDPARALRSWERYREQHPRGVLRAEADLSIIEMLTRLQQEGRALDEARGFLRRNPGSERRGEVARVAGDLARTGGDCAAAVGFYDQAAAARLSTADADDAAFHRAGCLTALHDGRAAAAVNAYLGRYPRGRHAPEAQRLRAVAAPAAALEKTRP